MGVTNLHINTNSIVSQVSGILEPPYIYVDSFSGPLNEVADLVCGVIKEFSGIVKSFFSAISEIFKTLSNIINTITSGLKVMFKVLKALMKPCGWIQKIIDRLTIWGNTLTKWRNTFNRWTTGANHWIDQALFATEKCIHASVDWLVKKVNQAISYVMKYVYIAFHKIQEWVAKFTEKVCSGINKQIDKFFDKLQENNSVSVEADKTQAGSFTSTNNTTHNSTAITATGSLNIQNTQKVTTIRKATDSANKSFQQGIIEAIKESVPNIPAQTNTDDSTEVSDKLAKLINPNNGGESVTHQVQYSEEDLNKLTQVNSYQEFLAKKCGYNKIWANAVKNASDDTVDLIQLMLGGSSRDFSFGGYGEQTEEYKILAPFNATADNLKDYNTYVTKNSADTKNFPIYPPFNGVITEICKVSSSNDADMHPYITIAQENVPNPVKITIEGIGFYTDSSSQDLLDKYDVGSKVTPYCPIGLATGDALKGKIIHKNDNISDPKILSWLQWLYADMNGVKSTTTVALNDHVYYTKRQPDEPVGFKFSIYSNFSKNSAFNDKSKFNTIETNNKLYLDPSKLIFKY